MPCYVSDRPGGRMFICGENLDLGLLCADCGDLSEYLCDYPVGDGKTCDRPLCEVHAHEIGPNLHYCQAHLEMWEQFRASGGVKRELENVVPFRAPEADR